jgi:hypothetical protein
MPIEYGGQGNVFGYNYSFDPINSDRGAGRDAEMATDYLMGDVLTHGGNARWNLWEGNVVATIRFDAVLGGGDFNTAFRNRVQRKGLPSTVVACFGSDIQWNNLNENLVGNVYEAPPADHPTPLRRWGTNQDSDLIVSVSDASNANPVVITWEGSFPLATGSKVTITGVEGNTAANVANATVTVIDDTHFSLDGVDGTESGSYSGGGTIDGVDARSQATTLLDGEYDFTANAATWIPGSDHILPDSLYLKAKPAWFGSLAWPGIDPKHPAATAITSNPAVQRAQFAGSMLK